MFNSRKIPLSKSLILIGCLTIWPQLVHAENVQGDIARTYFYMADRYGLPIRDDQRRQWTLWHLSDPPSFQEITKAYRIHYLTGLRQSWLY